MFKRYVYVILLMSMLYPPMVVASDSCASPTATLTLNALTAGQNLDKPYIGGSTTNGESLYYKIDIADNGTLDLKTAIDSTHSSDAVNTYGYFLDASCNQILEASDYQSDPRLVSTSVSVDAGKTYFFKVENHEITADGVDGFERGYFQIENTFTKTIPAHEISLDKTSASSVDSGAILTYTLSVTNTGSEETQAVQVVDTLPAEFIYVDSRNDADWTCTQSGQTITCDLSSGTIAALGGVKRLYLDVKAKFFSVDTLTTNSATVDVTYADSTTISTSDNQTVNIYKAVPNITMDKRAVKEGTTAGLTNIVENMTFDYILKVTNNSSNALMTDSNVWVRDNVPAEFSVVSITPDVPAEWSCSGLQDFDCNLLVDLAQGTSRELRVHVKAVGGAGSSVINTADAEADTPLGAATGSDSDIAIVDIDAVNYVVDFTKVNTDSSVEVGSETTYTFSVKNSSNVSLTNVRVLDVMPSEVSVDSITQSGWTCQAIAANTVDCLTSLSAGETKTIIATATANTIKNAVANTATLSTDQIADKTATATIDIVGDAQVSIEKIAVSEGTTTGINEIVKNNSFEYILKVTNTTSNAIMIDSNVWIRDNVPAEFSVISITPDVPAEWSCSGLQNFDCNLLVDLAKDVSRELRVKVKAVGASGAYTNIADAEADTPAGAKTATDTDTASMQIIDASYSVDFTKTNPQSSVPYGSETTYTLSVTNSSNMPLTNVHIKDVLPSDLNATAIVQSGWTCQAISSNTIDCDTTLAVGEVKSIDVKTAAINVRNAVVNTATLSCDQLPDKNASKTIDIVSSAQILMEKMAVSEGTTSEINEIVKNNSFEYILKVTNTTSNAIMIDSNVWIHDNVPADFNVTSIIPDVPAEWSCTSGQNIACNLLVDLAQGASREIRVKVKATGLTGVGIDNTADAEADTPEGAKTATDSDIATVKIVDITYSSGFTKTNPQSSVPYGSETTYTLSVTNSSNMPLTNVHIKDVLPSDLNATAIVQSGWTCQAISSNTIDCDTTLAVGEVKSIDVKAIAINVRNAVVNTATLSCDQLPDKNASKTIDIVGDAKIVLRKTAVEENTTTAISSVIKGNSFDYILQVTNATSNKNMIAKNTWIRDNVPAEFTVVSITPDVPAEWSCTGLQNFDCKLLVDLNQTDSREIRINVQATGVAGTYTNTANAEADTPAGTKTAIATDTASMQIIDASYAADFRKTNSDTSVLIGNETNYMLIVTNNSNMPLTNVRIKDMMPSDLNLSIIIQNGWTCKAIVSNTLECNTTLDVGETKIIVAQAIAINVKSGVLNTATLSSDQLADQNASEMIDIVDFPSSMAITKTSSQDTILENDIFSYQISVQNNGLGSEHNLTVTDEIPNEFTLDGNITSGNWTCSVSANSVYCTLATLPAGESADDINITVKAPSHIAVDKTVSNIAKVVSEKETVGLTAQKDVNLLSPSTAISIHLNSNPNTVFQGESFVYELFITNNSAKTTSSVLVSALLPTDVVFDHVESGGWMCDYNNTSRIVSCDTNGTMLVGGDKQINIHVVAPNYEVNVTGSVKVSTDLDPYIRDANVTTIVKGKVALLSFTQQNTDRDPVLTDEIFTYGIKVKNDGVNRENDINATNVKVEMDLFATLYDIDINATGWDCNQSGTLLTCVLQTALAPSVESPPIYIGVKSNAEGLIITGIKLTSDQSPSSVDTSILEEVNKIINTNLSLEVSDSSDPVEANDAFSYIIKVSNPSMENVQDVTVNLETTSLANFTLESVSATGWNCTQSLKQVNCDADVLLGGSISTIVLNVRAPDVNTTLEVNATLRSDYVNDSDLSDNTVSESTQVLKLDFDADNLREFTQVLINGKQNTNIFGEVFTIGNQSICEQSSPNVCQEPSYDANDWINQQNVNLDASSPYASSTSATLNISANDEVIWAGLYWMGMIDRNNGSDANMIDNARYVYFKHDSEASYVNIESSLGKFNWKNDVSFGSNNFDYQGVADVTAYVKAHKDGVYWVAGIQTTEGYNISAGWSLVVVVEDKTQTRKLKNITLFDGYQAVWKNTAFTEANQYPDFVKAHVSGFLTPNNGAVSSTLSLFGLEGDKSLDDSISIADENNITKYLSNVLNPVDDVVNGTITKNGVVNHNRFPDLANTSGIDIDTFDISAIIGNGQSATDITIYSKGDRFFLGMFSFSTELYLPNMCYVETMTNKDYTPLTNGRQFFLGDPIGFEISIENKENETARNVSIKTKVDVIYRETNSTLQVKNIAEASYTDNVDLWDTYEINTTNDKNDTVPQTIFDIRIGSGADSSSGGDMSNGDSIAFRYNGIVDGIPDSNKTRNIYYISYDIDNMASVVETSINPCYDFNQTIYVNENNPRGFGITHEGGLSDGVDDNSNNENHLFTQLTDTSFNIDLVGLNDALETTRVHKGVVRLDLVDLNSTGGCNEENPTIKYFYISFNDENRVTTSLNFSLARQPVALRVQYPLNKYKDYATWTGVDVTSLIDLRTMLENSHDATGYPCESECNSNLTDCQNCIFNPLSAYTEVSCSSDTFAIRPKGVSMDTNSTLVGGRDYNLTFDANASGYNTIFPINTPQRSIRRTLIKPSTCTVPDVNETILSTPLTFVEGNASVLDFSYTNIGNIAVILIDSIWTLSDQNSTDATMSDCVIGSASNIKNVDGKYGCNIEGAKTFSFVPARFKNEVNLQNDGNSTFTYLDDIGTRRARAFMTITALLDDNTTATNYTSGCYAKDINYTFGPATAIPSMHVYSDERVQQLGSNQFKTMDGNFSAGKAFPVIGINFARSKTTAVNPFDLNSSALYIYLQDEDAVEGDGFENDMGQAKYYYARLYAPDYLSIENSNFRAGLFYEVYCDEESGCDKGAFNLTGFNESRDHVNWYIFNPNHSWKYGDYDASSIVSSSDLGVSAASAFSLDLNLSSSANRPYCDRISLTPDTWFAYDEHSPVQADKLSFKACFISTGSWAGTGEVGMAVDANISRDKNTKIDW